MAKFAALNTQVLSISIDHVPCLVAWGKSLGQINFPMLSDFWPHGEVAQKYGAFRTEAGHSERALFIIDKEGIIQYIDIHDIDDQPSNEALFAELRRIDPAVAANTFAEPAAADLPKGGIVLYCTPWCADCKDARAWLDERGLAYTEVNVNANAAAAAQVRAWANGALITPTFDINGTIVLDFDQGKLAQVVG
jgi:glutaredoxin